jgi:redox-regulated HSP33 family molecular chaperone
MLISLGPEEPARMLEAQATIDLRCDFCSRLTVSRQELAFLMEGRG